MKTGGKFWKVGGKNNFRETGGNVLKYRKLGEIRNLWSMTKKRVIRSFGGWKWRNLSGKGKLLKIFVRVRKFFENRGEIWNRGKMHHGLRGDGRPCLQWRYTCNMNGQLLQTDDYEGTSIAHGCNEAILLLDSPVLRSEYCCQADNTLSKFVSGALITLPLNRARAGQRTTRPYVASRWSVL